MGTRLNNIFIKDTFWKHWQWYKKFFNITVFRYLVTWFAIVPLFAKIFSNIPDKVTIAFIKESHYFTLKLPFHWELLWLSSILFVIAYVLYLIYCPQFIKTYSSFKDYKLHYHSPRWLCWLANDIVLDKNEIDKFFERMNKKKYLDQRDIIEKEELPRVDVEEKQSILSFEYQSNVYSFSMPRLKNGNENKELTDIAEREVFWEVSGRFSSSKQNVRRIIIWLLYVSGLLFGYVLLENICTAIQYFMR